MKGIVKKLLIACFVLFVGSLNLQAQDAVNFEFSDGIDNDALKNKMERQMMNLLTAINRAQASNSDINFSGINIDDVATQCICMLWNNVHFRTMDDDIVEHCLQLRNSSNSLRGYQVRNVAIEMFPLDDTYTDDRNQEVCVDFDPAGNIVDFNISMGITQYTKLKIGRAHV